VTAPATAEHALVVKDLRTHFAVPAGDVKAVDGVSFTLDRGKTLCIEFKDLRVSSL
jgi:peptide/nickel transport system ATP-binding protein